MKIAAFCDRDTAIGLRFSGIQTLFIADKNLLDIWNEIIDQNDIGILLITEKIAEEIGRDLNDYRMRNNFPIVVEIPDKKGHIENHVDYVSYLIKKAVGVEINK